MSGEALTAGRLGRAEKAGILSCQPLQVPLKEIVFLKLNIIDTRMSIIFYFQWLNYILRQLSAYKLKNLLLTYCFMCIFSLFYTKELWS